MHFTISPRSARGVKEEEKKTFFFSKVFGSPEHKYEGDMDIVWMK